MSALIPMDPARRDQALDEAVGRNLPVVLSLRQDEAWSVFKSRFLAGNGPSRRLYVEYPSLPHRGKGPPPVRPGENVGVAFRRGHKKCLFTTVALSLGDVTLHGQTRVNAIELMWPDQVQEVQRRAYYRITLSAVRNIKTLIWRGGAAQRGLAGTDALPICEGRITDLSAGGMRVLLPRGTQTGLRTDDSVGVEFQPEPDGPGFLLDALLRHVSANPDGTVALGIQFTGLEATPEGRRVLQRLLRIVNQYQRQELRRVHPAYGRDFARSR